MYSSNLDLIDWMETVYYTTEIGRKKSLLKYHLLYNPRYTLVFLYAGEPL